MKNKKLKIAIYWLGSCGGCEVALVELNEKILELAEIADIVLWPVALDFKYEDLEKLKAQEIDISLINGCIANFENEEIAKMLREKSKVLIAYGSCACFGGIPGLVNLATKEEVYKIAYSETPSTINPKFTTPQQSYKADAHELELPEFYGHSRALHQVVEVDYFVPGCAPPIESTEKLLEIAKEFAAKGALPPKGAVIGSEKSVCDECEREKAEKKSISKIYRIYEKEADPKKCLLDQGIICMGPATRGGCKARCLNANQPCIGCMGALPEALDQGAKMLSALASIIGVEEEKTLSEEDLKKIIDKVADPAGSFYKFSLPVGIISRKHTEKK
ncbi:MAG: oxidoreductase [Candidatus Thermoplasmatota archaeon]|nr:oxidoreductase [Candidatus Thermoplasmatota archaeon]